MSSQRLTAKRVRELLALKRVHNDFVLVGDTTGKVPYVTYRNGVAKQGIAAAWQVITPGRSTDAFEGSPRDDYNKTFVVPDARSPESRNDTLNAALKWASDTYQVDLATGWMKTPFGSYTVRDHLNARLRELLPREFDPDYRDPTVKKIVDKLYGDGDDSPERMFRVVVQLYVQPEPPLYVRAADEDAARRQVVQLFTRLAGTRILDGLKLSVYDA